MGNLKIHVIIIVFIVTLAVLLLGQHFIFQPRTLNNLEAQFADLPGIESVSVQSGSEGLSLTVHIGQDVGLKSTYDQLLALAKQAGIPSNRIVLQDDRGPILSHVLYKIHYAIAQGIATGQFQFMDQFVEDELVLHDITDSELWVDKEFVYLEMHFGSEHLYQVFSREIKVQGEG